GRRVVAAATTGTTPCLAHTAEQPNAPARTLLELRQEHRKRVQAQTVARANEPPDTSAVPFRRLRGSSRPRLTGLSVLIAGASWDWTESERDAVRDLVAFLED